ncbi:MAG: glycoside hydrolase [Armatimonadetes bacterium]|nr:glycoside hydrolase [Armatimonadota bacterium]
MIKTPHGGIQPQAVTDKEGVLHLLYFQGDPGKGDLYYVRQQPGQSGFSPPLRVNQTPGSAVAIGTIRGGQIALGKEGRAHVVWFGSEKAGPLRPGKETPLAYTRLNNAGTAFEPERNLMTFTTALDGGPSVAADQEGNVYAVWHAGDGSVKGEVNRRLWIARSTDGGKTFTPETSVWSKPTGACACCSVRAFVDHNGMLFVLYRAATEGVHRDTYLLASSDRGKSFTGTNIHKWKLPACPMSSAAFAEGPDGIYGAWETQGRVNYGRIGEALRVSSMTQVPGVESRLPQKHPTLAVNGKGEILLAWTEGTGWDKGGDLVWQVYDSTGNPTPEKGRVAGGIPVWGLPTAIARQDGSFMLIH